jgi:IclR family acetate operon transcriptional repressor
LSTLVARGYAAQSTTGGHYLLGPKVAELAAALNDRSGLLRTIARPHLTTVQRSTGESANLSVLLTRNTVYIDHVDGIRSVRMLAQIGAAVPAHASAAGKAMLAHLAPQSLREILGGDPLEALTPATITTLDELERQLATIRSRGYALDDEEHEPGVGCVAAPVFDERAAVVAAISVSAPVQRIRSEDPAKLGALLAAQAGEISRSVRAHAAPGGSGAQ